MKRMLCIGAMNTGGAESFLMKLYRHIDRTNYQFDFFEPLSPCNYDDEILSLGGKIFRSSLKTENLVEYKRNLQEVITKEGYRYVFKSTPTAFSLIDFKFAKEFGVTKCIARSSNSRVGSGLGEILNIYGKFCYLKYVDLMLAPSQPSGRHLFGENNLRSEKFKIIHNGLDVEQYQRDEKFRREFRQENGLTDSFVIGHIGRFQKQKNHLFLISIFNEIRKIRKNAKLLLIGEKKYLYPRVLEAVKTFGLERDVLFLGERKDADRLYSVMDVLLFPSLYEGLPNVVVEAQAARLPCLISSSITNEVVETELVRQFSLERSPKHWAEVTLDLVNELDCTNVNLEDFKKKYDVKQIANWFQNEVFENNV